MEKNTPEIILNNPRSSIKSGSAPDPNTQIKWIRIRIEQSFLGVTIIQPLLHFISALEIRLETLTAR